MLPRFTRAAVASLATIGLASYVATTSLSACTPRRPVVVAPPAPVEPPEGAAMVDAERLPLGDAPTLGRRDAKVTVLAFVNPRDGFAAELRTLFAALRARYPRDVRIAVRTHHGALASPDGARAAAALRVAHEQGRFTALFDALAAEDDALDDATLARLVATAAPALDAAHALEALRAPALAARIDDDVRLSRALANPDPAPVLYVNGTRVHGVHSIERFVPLIDAALAAAQGVSPPEQAYARAVASPLEDPLGTPAPGPGHAPVRDLRVRYRVAVERAPTAGAAEALVTLVLFEDLQSPACVAFESRLQELRDRFGPDLRVAFRAAPHWTHRDAQLAAEALFEAQAQGGDAAFLRLRAVMYAHHSDERRLTREALERHAHEAGLDEGRFRAALEGHVHRARLDEDQRAAARLGVDATPGLFVNGRFVPAEQPIEAHLAVIQRAISEANALVQAGAPRDAVYEHATREGAESVGYLSAFEDGQPRYPAADDATGPVAGRTGASATVIHFADLESDGEAQRAPMLAQLVRAYGERVRVIYRELPDADAHPHAQLAAEAVREAFAQRGFVGYLRFREAILRAPTRMERADFEAIARAQGLNPMRFREAMNNRIRRADVARERSLAEALGVRITAPSTIVNGRLFGPGASPAEIQQFVDREIAAAATRAP